MPTHPGFVQSGSNVAALKTMKKTMAVLALALAAGLALAGIGRAEQKQLSIGTGDPGGVYFPLGGAVASVLAKALPDLHATVEVTGGSVDNINLIAAGQSDLGFTMADAAMDAIQGQDKFRNNKVALQTLLVVYPNRMHVVTVEDSGINTLADLKGKRVSTGSPGSATEIMASRAVEAVGLDKDKDIQRERLGVAESVNALTDKRIDAFFWVGGIPTAAVTDLAATPGVKVKLLDHAEYVDAMNKKAGPLYAKGVIPAGSYAGQDKASQNVDVWNILVAPEKMSEQMAYSIVKTVFEHKPELVAVHKEADNIDLKNQSSGSPLPFHPGAKKYLAERGVTVK